MPEQGRIFATYLHARQAHGLLTAQTEQDPAMALVRDEQANVIDILETHPDLPQQSIDAGQHAAKLLTTPHIEIAASSIVIDDLRVRLGVAASFLARHEIDIRPAKAVIKTARNLGLLAAQAAKEETTTAPGSVSRAEATNAEQTTSWAIDNLLGHEPGARFTIGGVKDITGLTTTEVRRGIIIPLVQQGVLVKVGGSGDNTRYLVTQEVVKVRQLAQQAGSTDIE